MQLADSKVHATKQSPPRKRIAYKSRMRLSNPRPGDTWEICAPEDSSPLHKMRGFTLNNFCQCGLLACLVFFSFMSFTAAVSFDLTELRNKVAKIKVNPRGNLWATGHFMGKKSVMDPPLLPSAEGQGVDALKVNLSAEQSALVELFQEFLRVALQAQVETQESRSKNVEADMLMKILESYIQSRK